MTDIEKRVATVESIGARCILYTILCTGVGFLPALDIAMNPFNREILFTEYSFVQLAQTVTLVMGILAMGRLLYLKVLPQLSFLVVALLACALVRESDSFLDALADGLWQTMATLILVGTVFHLVPQRKTMQTQIAYLGGHFSFGLMLSGFIIIMGFSRVFGRGAMWQQIMGAHYNKSIKNFAEESIELLGYVILAIGVIEFSVAASRRFHHSRAQDKLVERSSHYKNQNGRSTLT